MSLRCFLGFHQDSPPTRGFLRPSTFDGAPHTHGLPKTYYTYHHCPRCNHTYWKRRLDR